MANTNNQEKQQEQLIETVSKTEQFYNENKKTIWGVVGGIAAVVVACVCFHTFVSVPKAKEAQEQMMQAEVAFQNGLYEVALKGDGNNLGFEQVIEEYGAKGGEIVYLYAGICELNAAAADTTASKASHYESAVSYLKSYSGKEPILAARAISATADAYVGLENYAEAASLYKKAAAKSDNIFAAAYLVKAGQVYEELGNTAAALECYKSVKENYPSSFEARTIAKYISRIENK